MGDDQSKNTATLRDEDIGVSRKVGRRSMFRKVSIIAGGSVAATVLGACGGAQTQTGATDSDSGPNQDAAGSGQATGMTDSDSGPNQDAAGGGQGTGASDSDTGPNADPAGAGQTTQVTDNDLGSNQDSVGSGQGGY